VRSQLDEQLVLERQRVDVAPSVLEADAGADEDERQVVVQDVGAQRHDDDEIGRQCDRDQKEPRECRVAEISPGAAVEPERL
jgi:hypothetical protein